METTTKAKHRAGVKHKKKHKKGVGQHTGEGENGAVSPTVQIEDSTIEEIPSPTIEGTISLSACATEMMNNLSTSADYVEDESQATATILNELQQIEEMFDAEIEDAITVAPPSSSVNSTKLDERVETDSPTGGLVNLDDLRDELNNANIIRSISKSSENSSSSQGLSFDNFFDSIESYAENEYEYLKVGVISEVDDVHKFLFESIDSFRNWCLSPTQSGKDKVQLCYSKALALIEKLKRDRDYLLLRQSGMSPKEAEEAAAAAATNNFDSVNAYNLRKNIEFEKSRSGDINNVEGGIVSGQSHQWEVYDVTHPTPSCALDSPVIEHLLQSWTDDRNKIEYFLAWIQCLSFELPENFPKGVQVVDLQSTIRDGFLIMLLPLIRSISLYKVTAFTRISKVSSMLSDNMVKDATNDKTNTNDNDASFAEIYAEEFLKEDTYDIRFKISPAERIDNGDSNIENIPSDITANSNAKDQEEQTKQQSGIFSAFQFFQMGKSSANADTNNKTGSNETSPAPSTMSTGFSFFSPQNKDTTENKDIKPSDKLIQEKSSDKQRCQEGELQKENSLEETLKEESDGGYRPAFTLFNKILGYNNQKQQENTGTESSATETDLEKKDVQVNSSDSMPVEEGVDSKKSNEANVPHIVSQPPKVQESSASLVFSLFSSPIASSAGNSAANTPATANAVTPSSNITPNIGTSATGDAVTVKDDNGLGVSSSSAATSILDSVNTFVSPISSLFVGNKELSEEEKKQLEADEAIKKRLGKDVPGGNVNNVKTIPLRSSANNPQGIKRNEKANAIAAKLASLRGEKR